MPVIKRETFCKVSTESLPIVALTRETPPAPPDKLPLSVMVPVPVAAFQLLDSMPLTEP